VKQTDQVGVDVLLIIVVILIVGENVTRTQIGRFADPGNEIGTGTMCLARFGLVFERGPDRGTDALGDFVEDEMGLKDEAGQKQKQQSVVRWARLSVGWRATSV
jgi:hypothetical protein